MPAAKPYSLQNVLQHPLARLLPLRRNQDQVYRMGERIPPSALDGYGPVWEAVSMSMAALQTLQARINLQRAFTLIAISASASVTTNGGFRAQFYDLKRRIRFADRGVKAANFAGNVAGPGQSPMFLREPYAFMLPDSQILLNVQNFESAANTIQIVFYGQVLRFNEPAGRNFPGGIFSGWDWQPQSEGGAR